MTAHTIPDLDAGGLRNFALTTGAIIAVLFGLIFPWLLGAAFRSWPWVLAVVLGGWGLIHPTSLGPVYRLWMKFGLLLNRVTTPVILGVVFYVLFTPIALGMRLFGRDTMSRRFDAKAASYRKPSRVREKHSVENPF